MSAYRKTVFPILSLFRPETANHIALTALEQQWLQSVWRLVGVSKNLRGAPSLQKRVAGITFANPIGFAAGLSKDSLGIRGLQELGFGFGTIGTTLPKPQTGNPRPRVFRLKKNRAIINRMGFNSEGVASLLARMQVMRDNNLLHIPIGVSISANRTTVETRNMSMICADYETTLREVAQIAEWIEINVSSPNTKNLRKMQGEQNLDHLLSHIEKCMCDHELLRRPIAVKLSPDFNEDNLRLSDIIHICKKNKVKIIVATNTTVRRDNLVPERHIKESGGLSGPNLFPRVRDLVRELRRLNWEGGIIAVGGIENGEQAVQVMKEGADLIQVFTGFVYNGPALVNEITHALSNSK